MLRFSSPGRPVVGRPLLSIATAEAPNWMWPPTAEDLPRMTWLAFNHGAGGRIYSSQDEVRATRLREMPRPLCRGRGAEQRPSNDHAAL